MWALKGHDIGLYLCRKSITPRFYETLAVTTFWSVRDLRKRSQNTSTNLLGSRKSGVWVFRGDYPHLAQSLNRGSAALLGIGHEHMR